jgi:GNAT superfamily N-acetyltransferase
MHETTIEIMPIRETDIIFLEKCFPEGGSAKHAERFESQNKGDITYLIAWRCDHPVGHALLNWGGEQDEHVAKQLQSACPDLEDIFVLAELRSHGIGSQLISYAEQLASQRGFAHLGLSVAATTNDAARRLYERLGYQDAHLGEYLAHGEYLDEKGQPQCWKEMCIYLIKELIMTIK